MPPSPYPPPPHTLSSLQSLDSTIRVWDVPTGQCVDWLAFESAPTSIAVSPTGEFIATSHVGQVGISLWADKSFYQTVYLSGAPSAPSLMDQPAPTAETDDEAAQGDALALSKAATVSATSAPAAIGQKGGSEGGESLRPKEQGLVTMSGLPAGHWKTLFHLELVKERNKPKEAPQKPVAAPFFLQRRSDAKNALDMTTAPVDSTPKAAADAGDPELDKWESAWSDNEDDDEQLEAAAVKKSNGKVVASKSATPAPAAPAPAFASRILRNNGSDASGQMMAGLKRKMLARSHLAQLLESCMDRESRYTTNGDSLYSSVTDYMKTLSASGVDVALSTLCNGEHDDEGIDLLILCCNWLNEACESNQNFECVNAYMHRFLSVHSDVIRGVDIEVNADGEVAKKGETGSVTAKRASQHKQFLEIVRKLAESQKASSALLKSKLQNTVCLLQHFANMI